GLPSHSGPGGVAALGPHDIAMLGRGDARFSIGWGNDPALRSACGAVGPKMDWIARLTASGNWRLETDLGAYEAANNPDGGVPDRVQLHHRPDVRPGRESVRARVRDRRRPVGSGRALAREERRADARRDRTGRTGLRHARS